MKKYKRGQMGAMTANLFLNFDENVTRCHQFLQRLRHSLDSKCWKKVLETLQVLKIAGSMQIQKPDSANSLSTQFTAAQGQQKQKWLTGYAVMTMWS